MINNAQKKNDWKTFTLINSHLEYRCICYRKTNKSWSKISWKVEYMQNRIMVSSCTNIVIHVFHWPKYFYVSDCREGWWGVMCRSQCQCQHASGCDAVTGECVCQPGWFGSKCAEGTAAASLIMNKLQTEKKTMLTSSSMVCAFESLFTTTFCVK